MKFNELPATEIKFSREEIYSQLQKIFIDPAFSGSDILKRFLMFVVEQTLLGHSNWLKEYTIGVKVLNKPPDFKPQESGIVRIHAGRLRRALHHYYLQNMHDAIFISIPKGSYIPAFTDSAAETTEENAEGTTPHGKPLVIAVAPFNHQNSEFRNSFTDGLCMQLSNSLMHLENFSVIAYHIMRNLFEKFSDIKEIASLVEAQYLITGDIQSKKDRVRVNVQMIETSTSKQVWSQMYERNFSETNIFDLQDEIAKLIVSELDEFCNAVTRKSRLSVMAVA